MTLREYSVEVNTNLDDLIARIAELPRGVVVETVIRLTDFLEESDMTEIRDYLSFELGISDGN